MKKVNKTRFAVLGMLFEKPRSGYEIRQFMIESTDFFWQETDASIYPMLKTLEAEGKATAKSEFVGKRERKIFSITQKGRDELLEWMLFPPVKASRRNELLLKVFFGSFVSQKDILKHLLIRQQKVQKKTAELRSVEANVLAKVSDDHPHKLFWKMTLRYGLIHAKAELQWLTECCKALEK